MIAGIVTGLLLALFIGAWIWAWSPKRKRAFDEAARLPLEEGEAKGRTEAGRDEAQDDKQDEKGKPE
ncbi:CcoQ/FixQ family Cbb3-type cytochrome c oxidase assembly chaperone [Pseudoxanthomonas suwonensis]|uniref:Uncharacterized protein n=1 Tax=Pseudoxanthomonas suwonensis TaxID=314722 RepID=A0A0E3Z2U2_9GAMM|nr:CcoQ/FixQ family Cbb3-type cytochrome c oxidase assembly chaperone [Pseudoxanthomonas suwonensis]AKC86392.1 hypothetical protein WQ53_06035 [Pseudoxanthomonas suwonensis]